MSGKSSKPPDSVAVRKSGMGKLERLPISDKPLDHLYERIKTIDDGTGNLGGMNAGVHIVRARKTGQFYVQKCYRSADSALIKLFREEIGYMRASTSICKSNPWVSEHVHGWTISNV